MLIILVLNIVTKIITNNRTSSVKRIPGIDQFSCRLSRMTQIKRRSLEHDCKQLTEEMIKQLIRDSYIQINASSKIVQAYNKKSK